MTEFQLEGAPNFRDLGGYANRHGQRIRAGKLFRSDHLGQLTPSDIRFLHDSFGAPWRVLDFRGVQERSTAPCQLPNAQVHALSIEPTIVQKITDLLAQAHTVSHEETVRLMQDTYRGFVRHNTHRYAEFFSTCWRMPMPPWSFTAQRARTAPGSRPPCCCMPWTSLRKSSGKTT